MNCKQGDLAILVRSGSGNEGKIVRCLRFVGEVPGWYGDDRWETDTILPGCFGGKTNTAQDAWLRPLRGDLLDEETEKEKELVR